jgi:hypothetical protein
LLFGQGQVLGLLEAVAKDQYLEADRMLARNEYSQHLWGIEGVFHLPPEQAVVFSLAQTVDSLYHLVPLELRALLERVQELGWVSESAHAGPAFLTVPRQ